MHKSSNNTETVFLSLGSNLGDRKAHLRICLSRLSAIGKITATSSVYETQPWGKSELPNFLNQAVKIETKEKPTDFLSLILSTEIEMGRVRQAKWESRIIDIDILLFGDRIIETEKLTVPHPYLSERKFALVALNEIAPGVNHPVLNKSIHVLLNECKDELDVKKIN
jgi:2-amino-4-hydroxy-6-hydroxymethyldihydropteridine diphosphokinase